MTLEIPFIDLAAQHLALADAMTQAIARVIRNGQFILGAEVESFEKAAAAFLGGRHVVGVSSGTDALLVALTALGVGSGDEVVTTPFTFFATVEGILRLGARPVFVDVESATLNLDIERLASAFSPRTRAVIPVHLFGSPVRMDELLELTESRGIPVVEDAAQSFGSRHRGRPAGTWGALGCFSFFPSKVLGALGDAGLVVTNDDALALRCRALRQHGSERRGEHQELGGNFRLDAVQAAVLSVKLAHVESWIRRRLAHARAYDVAFRDAPELETVRRADGSNGAVYSVRVRDGRRDGLVAHLRDHGIGTGIYYDRPLHFQPALSHMRLGPGSLPEAERAAREVLSLPCYPELTDGQRDRIVESVQAFFR